MQKFLKCLLLCSALAGAGLSHAQFAKPEDAIKYRKAGFTLMAAHFGRLSQMAQGKLPYDAKVAADNADVLAALAKLPFTGFIEGSDKGDTRAKPEIWKEAAKFKESVDKNQAEMAKVVAAAKSGSLDALKAAVGPAGSSCKACHDNFRKD